MHHVYATVSFDVKNHSKGAHQGRKRQRVTGPEDAIGSRGAPSAAGSHRRRPSDEVDGPRLACIRFFPPRGIDKSTQVSPDELESLPDGLSETGDIIYVIKESVWV